ncbi:MAG: TolC family protein [Bacteroidaceae bacterium]|nr:TolC family protein [Bacteroidaceae bacterium]
MKTNRLSLSVISLFVRRVMLLLLLLPSCSFAWEGDTLTLTLPQAIEMAKKQSPSARSARHTFLAQYWNYRYYRANYLPSLTLNSSPYINNEINKITQGDGTSLFLSQSQFGGDLSLSINQNIPLTGGTFFIRSSVNYLREMESKMNMFSTVPVSIGYSQSLFGYNSLKWDRRIEPLRYAEAKKSYAETIELVSAQACNHFFNLATAQSNLSMAHDNYANADTLYRMAQGRYKLGTITENEMLQLEIRRLSEEANAMDAQIAHEETLQQFRSFLGLGQDTYITLLLPDSVPDFTVPFPQALEMAMRNSPDPVYYERIRKEAGSNLANAKANAGLKADIYLQFGLSQTGNTLPGAYKRPMTQEYGSLTISFPILDWGRGRGKVRVARSQQELVEIQAQQGMEDFTHNVQKLVSQFNMQARKVRIARLTDRRARHRHMVAMRLYIMGQNTLLDLNDAIAEQNSAGRSYLYAMSTYWSLYYTLRSMTGYDFREHCSITEQLPEIEK